MPPENTRGRRQAALPAKRPAEMEIEPEDEAFRTPEADDFGGSDEPIILLPGDTIMAKVTHAIEIEGEESWFTFGCTSRILPGEREEDAYFRLSATVNSRVLDLVSDSVDMMHNRQAAFEAQQQANAKERRRTRRIAVDNDG